MTNYKIILLASALLISGLTNAEKNKGSKTPPLDQVHKVTAGNCPNTTAQVDININNVRARILNGGDMWWDPISQTNYYEVPKGSNKNSLYSGAIWIAGFDANGALKVAAQTYRQTGANDFWSGPISKDAATGTTSITQARCAEFDRIWQITKNEVSTFVAGGEASAAIKDWPGNGNAANGELQFLAPFFDSDNDGIYDYTKGDYPYYNLSGVYNFDSTLNSTVCNDYLFGDKTLWWVFNDVGNIHTETNSDPIGLEIRAQAFEFQTNDEINNMTFYKYQIINRSSDSLRQTYMGQWADPDLGNAADDYVGCDVNLGLGFVYNADPDDEGAGGYGLNPPSLGIDFFQGPLADPHDNIDNNHNGVIDEAGEQIIMSKFVYYQNLNNNPQGNPFTTNNYYQYLQGQWLDGKLITFGGDGYANQTNPPCNYMFPGNTDPAFPGQSWTMADAGPGVDVRFLESAGTFSLAPGAVNYVSTGVVWARTGSGGPLASLSLVKLADQKAQSLFDNCFKVLDGPDAPDVAIREVDRQLIISLENTKSKRVELYNEIDPTIPPSVLDDTGGIVALTTAEKSYKFQGYQVYQLADRTVSALDVNDISKARLVQQIDIKDSITSIVNFELDPNTGFFVPVKETNDVNTGLSHTLTVSSDAFTGQPLINYKPYYYMVKSYAYNNYRQFDTHSPLLTQTHPYFPGRLNIKVYSGIPHKPYLNNGGTVLNVTVGTLPVGIKRIEGQGNGGNALDLTDATVNEILTDPLSRSVNPVYTPGHAPIRLGVYDPFKLSGGNLALKFTGVADTSKWYLFNQQNLADTIDSSAFGISVITEEIIASKGLTVAVTRVSDPGYDLQTNNGFIEGTITYPAGSKQWLSGVVDNDSLLSQDWIRSGAAATDKKGDAGALYESVLGGTWAPYLLTDFGTSYPGSPKFNNPNLDPPAAPTSAATKISWSTLNSVDVVITPDKSKWSRSVVFQLSNDNTALGLRKFNKRMQASVDKDGNTNTPDANLVDPVGMSWFPGYAINVETGERLNIGFGEDSTDVDNHGNDMLWNPTYKVYDDTGAVVFGGKHYIYIFNKYYADTSARIPIYDNCARIDTLITIGSGSANKAKVFKSCIWTSLPVLADNTVSFSQGNIPPSEVKIRLRVTKPYAQFLSIGASATNGSNPDYEFDIPTNLAPNTQVESVAKTALDNVNVVPNPYYAYSSYEKTREDQLDTRIRFTNLPSHCTVSIYTTNGTLIRQLRRDVIDDVSLGQAVSNGQDFNLSSTLDWDLKNTAGIPIASGIYIIHINAGSLGEKVIKWFGIMRPLDLDTF